MNSDDKFEILNEIDSWEKETKKLENSDEDRVRTDFRDLKKITDLYAALADCE